MSEKSVQKEMSFLDHLEELRWHLIRITLAVTVFSLLGFIYKDFFWHNIILAPSKTDFITFRLLCKIGKLLYSDDMCVNTLPFTIQNRTMAGQFSIHLTSSIWIGLICAFPYILFEIWRFIKPALYFKEVKAVRGIVFIVSTLFFIGILFGYYVLAPLSIQFLANYQVDPSILNQVDISSYLSTLGLLTLSTGIVFQLPVVIFFLAKAGIASPAFLRHYRKHAVVIILIVAAIVTPPDVFSQILMALPLLVLYEISIFVAAAVTRGKERVDLYQR